MSGPGAARQFEALPGTREELRKVAQLVGESGWNVTSYEAARPTEAAVIGAARPRVLHLATHGFFETPTAPTNAPRDLAQPAADDPMLRSGLARISHQDSESWAALAKQVGRSPAEA